MGHMKDLSAKILELFNAALVFIVRWADQDGPLDIFCYPQKSDVTPDPKILNSAFQKESPLRRRSRSGEKYHLVSRSNRIITR